MRCDDHVLVKKYLKCCCLNNQWDVSSELSSVIVSNSSVPDLHGELWYGNKFVIVSIVVHALPTIFELRKRFVDSGFGGHKITKVLSFAVNLWFSTFCRERPWN